jgi:hypothetical protein
MSIEQEIRAKGLTAPRVTPDDIEDEIESEHYFTAAQGAVHRDAINEDINDQGYSAMSQLTFCVLVLRNGFTVTGESACASPDNFDAVLGRKIARQNAVAKVWPLLGFRLRDRLHRDRDQIARVAHEVNRAYCDALGDTSQQPWDQAPEWQRISARAGVALHASGDFGPEASHESWMQQKLDDGWTYGEVKDAETKTHPCLVPFDQLPREQQAKDHLFRAVVHALR